MADLADNQNQLEQRRHPTLYFPDGDFVISATSRDKTYIEFYRVDKVFFARHSPVFNDMLSLGDGDSACNEQYDGAPKVHLLDDAEDVAGLVGAIYNAATLQLAKHCHDTPHKVTGIMRLAVKYDVEMIRTIILRHIESEWPQTVLEWEQLQREKLPDPTMPLITEDWKPSNVDRYPDPALAVRFSVEFNCPEIVSAAFYQLATEPDMRSKNIAWESLQALDLFMIIAGKNALAAHREKTAMEIKNAAASRCRMTYDDLNGDDLYPSSCCERYAANCAVKLFSVCYPVSAFPLTFLYRDQVFTPAEREVNNLETCLDCNATWVAIAETVKKAGEDMWRSLPRFFEFSRLQ